MIAGNIEIDNNTGPLYSISIDGQDRQFHIEQVASSSDEFSFLLSPDDLHIAYTTVRDFLHIYDIQNNTSTPLGIKGFPIAFSPDSRKLLYEYGGSTYPLEGAAYRVCVVVMSL
jgi:hypothetical protein